MFKSRVKLICVDSINYNIIVLIFVNRKMRDFYKIVRPVILPQLVVASFTIIFISFIVTLVIN